MLGRARRDSPSRDTAAAGAAAAVLMGQTWAWWRRSMAMVAVEGVKPAWGIARQGWRSGRLDRAGRGYAESWRAGRFAGAAPCRQGAPAAAAQGLPACRAQSKAGWAQAYAQGGIKSRARVCGRGRQFTSLLSTSVQSVDRAGTISLLVCGDSGFTVWLLCAVGADRGAVVAKD